MESDRPLAAALDASPALLRSSGEVVWRLTVSNRSGEGIVLAFPTAQLGDVLLERGGSECYRWSDGRMFAQVLSERRLEPGAAWTIPLEGTLDVEPGAYEAVGIFTCRPVPTPARMAVAVEAPA